MKGQMKSMLKMAALALAGAIRASSVAQASPISDYLIVRDFTGAQVAYASITEEDESADPSAIIFLSGIPIDPIMFGSPISLIESDDPTFFSDIVGIADLTARGEGLVLGFNSDSEAFGAVFAGPGTIMEEVDEELDVTQYLDPALRAAGFTAAFRSHDIPEPASLPLLGVGLIGLATIRSMGANKAIRI